MNFKVGDKVRIIRLDSGAHNTEIGDIGVIRFIKSDEVRLRYAVEFENTRYNYHSCSGYTKHYHGYWCSEKMLELVRDEKIIIYREGREVIAKNMLTGKKAIARCCPSDTFDFEIGAKLVFDRLFEKEIVKLNTKICVIESCSNEFTPGKIYEIVDGKIKGNKCIWPALNGVHFTNINEVKEYFATTDDRLNNYPCHFNERGVRFIEVVE